MGRASLIEAVTRTQADGDHRRGVEQIVEPIRFEYELSHSPFRVVASAGAAEQLLLRWTIRENAGTVGLDYCNR